MRNFSLLATLFFSITISAQERISLPQPDMKIEMSIVDALSQRHSSREYDERDISLETLSQILWAGCGINRTEESKITAPSAINAQDIVLFVCSKNGAWQYLPATNELQKVSDKDLRKDVAGAQSFAATAPISIIIASDHSKFGNRQQGAARMGMIDSGYVSENICLICTALGLNTVPRMTMNTDILKQELGLDSTFDLTLNHPIGYGK